MKTKILTPGAYAPTPNAKSVSKVEKFKWSISDEFGVLMAVPKEDLFIDDEYQRDLNESKVMAIARDWSWLACGALIVAERDGVFYVIDGMHRTAAALRRDDIKELPCVIFSGTCQESEAQGFLRANTFRKPLTSYDRFRAMLAVGDETALFVDGLIRQIGREAGDRSHSGVRCLTLLMRLADRDKDILSRIWPMVAALCDNEILHANILGGTFYLEKSMPEGESLTRARWKNRLLGLGYDQVLTATQKAAAFYETGGDKVYATGILNALNKGLSKRLIVPDLVS